MKVGDFVRRKNSEYPMLGDITKVNRKTVWVDVGGCLEEMVPIKDLVLLSWNEQTNRWQDAK